MPNHFFFLRKVVSVLSLLALAAGTTHSKAAQSGASQTGRTRLRFDADWRFSPDTSAPEGLQVSEWKVQPATGLRGLTPNGIPNSVSTLSPAWKQAHIGDDQFNGRYGLAWFRSDLEEIRRLGSGQPIRRALHFESVDDNCIVFFNGKQLLKHEGWDDEFDVTLTRDWVEGGPNVLILLVENTGGTGGIMKPVTLQSGRPQQPDGSPSQPGFDDSAWRTVHLPHDYVVEGVFDSKQDPSHGSLAAGAAWYRKSFEVPAAAEGRSVWLDFDGIYRDAVVCLNGVELAHHPSGYMGFRVDISRSTLYGKKNLLAVHVNAHKQEGWWYEGGGIYRHVWLTTADPVHVAPWGVYIQSEVQGPEGAANPPSRLKIQVRLVNSSAKSADIELRSTIKAPNGAVVATVRTRSGIASGATTELEQSESLPASTLWSIEQPRLYTVHTAVIVAGKEIDSQETVFGIRTIRFDAQKGFFLNGKSVKIKGTCNHQDFAGVGIAMPDSLLTWRIRKLKEMGSNAYRCSHNPPAAELLDACDRLGMVVMDETRHLGDTYSPKTSSGTGYADLSDLKDMLQRDRNHPSIIMWSMCNEEGLQGSAEGAKIFKGMKDVVHQYDTTRPVTCAMNGGWGYGITNVEDLQGGNYNPGGYDDFHRKRPDIPFYGSETASTVSTRGIYANDAVRGYVSAYDVNFPGWAQTAEDAWRPIAERDYVAGGYVWTGFDYKGEPTPYVWPCINSHFGIMDECGFPKDNWFYYRAWWGDTPIVHILPHWNWTGSDMAAKPVSVWCHSNCEKVELFINGKSLGVKSVPKYGHVEWSVVYTPGTLTARGYNGTSVAATDRIETTGPPAALRLSTDRTTLWADGEDVTMVAVAVVDARGRVVPTANNLVKFTVSGASVVAGVGNGDASSHEPDRASQRRAFNGFCLAVVQAGESAGKGVLMASAEGLKSATIDINVTKR